VEQTDLRHCQYCHKWWDAYKEVLHACKGIKTDCTESCLIGDGITDNTEVLQRLYDEAINKAQD